MPSYKLPFWLVFKETTILLLLLVDCLLLLCYVFVVCHKSITTAVPLMEIIINRQNSKRSNFICPQASISMIRWTISSGWSIRS